MSWLLTCGSCRNVDNEIDVPASTGYSPITGEGHMPSVPTDRGLRLVLKNTDETSVMSNPAHTVTPIRGDLHDLIVELLQNWSLAGGKTTAQCPALIVGQHREMVLLCPIGPMPRDQRGHIPRRCERSKSQGIAREGSEEGSPPGITMDKSEPVRSCEPVNQCRRGRCEVEHFIIPAVMDHDQIAPRFVHLHFIEIGYLFPGKDLIATAMPGEIAGRCAGGIREGEGEYLVIQALAHLRQIAIQQQ